MSYILVGNFVYYQIRKGEAKRFAMVKDRLIHYDGRVFLNLILLDGDFGEVINSVTLDGIEPASWEDIKFWKEVTKAAIEKYCDPTLALCNHVWGFRVGGFGAVPRFVCEKCRRTMYPEDAAKKLSERC